MSHTIWAARYDVVITVCGAEPGKLGITLSIHANGAFLIRMRPPPKSNGDRIRTVETGQVRLGVSSPDLHVGVRCVMVVSLGTSSYPGFRSCILRLGRPF